MPEAHAEKAVVCECSSLAKPEAAEVVAVTVLLVAFLLVNLLTASRSPTVWIDEVMYTDPAVNLYFGNGFTSTAWFAQTSKEFYAGNVPLYPVLLYLWVSLFGFSVTAVRSMNYALMIAAAIVLWLSLVKLRLVRFGWARMTLVISLLSAYGITFGYRSGRPDPMAILVFLTCVLAYSIGPKWPRYLTMVAVSALFPIARLQLAAYAFFLGVLLLVFLGKRFIREFLCVMFGVVLGFITLYILYSANGVWESFLKSIAGTSFVGVSVEEKLAESLNEFRIGGYRDYSFLLTLGLALSIALHQFVRKELEFRSMLFFGIVTSALVPPGLILIGIFPVFYSWMVLIPLMVCVIAAIEKLEVEVRSWQGLSIAGVLTMACLAGLPARLALTLYQWKERDYSTVEALVERNISGTDRVYCDYEAYYGVKKRAAATFLPPYLKVMRPSEKEGISVLIINPASLAIVSKELGGRWESGEKMGEELALLKRIGAVKYSLQIFRKS